MTKCWKCTAPATHIPKVVLRAFSGAAPAEMFFDLPTCLKHGPKPSELISDAAWESLVIAMVTHKKLAPLRDLTVVVLVSRKTSDVRDFYRMVQAGKGQKVRTEPVH